MSKVRTRSGKSKPGPKGTPLSDLLFWETLWFWVFRGLRGREPSKEERFVTESFIEDAKLRLVELMKLKNSLAASLGETDLVQQWRLDSEYRNAKSDITGGTVSLKSERALAEPKIWQALVQAFEASDAEGVRKAYRKSKRWLNPKWGGGIVSGGSYGRGVWMGRPYVDLLAEKAEKFVRASRDAYYPRRSSRDEKRPEFFARAMAGISCGIAPLTAIHRLRKLEHGPTCPCVHCKDDQQHGFYKAFYGALKEKKR